MLWRFNTIPMGNETGAETWTRRESAKTGGGGGRTRVIAGATSSAQVEQNIAAAGWTLSAEELAEIDRITR